MSLSSTETKPKMSESTTTSPSEPNRLTRGYGKATINYFAGSPLNRVAFLRGNNEFLSAAFSHVSAAIMLLDAQMSPLTRSDDGKKNRVEYVTCDDIKCLFPGGGGGSSRPFAKSDEDAVAAYDSSAPGEPLILFLGLDRSHQSDHVFRWKEDYVGRPYFAVHVAPAAGNDDDGHGRGRVTKEAAAELREKMEEKGLVWGKLDARAMTLDMGDGEFFFLAFLGKPVNRDRQTNRDGECVLVLYLCVYFHFFSWLFATTRITRLTKGTKKSKTEK